MTEKGKNVATREDIEAITHKIESVRANYTEEIERLRSSLSVSAGHRTAYAEGRRKALFQFFDRCAELLADKLLVNPGGMGLPGTS